MIKNISPSGGSKLAELHYESFHESFSFPADSDEQVVFTAKDEVNKWSDWAEIADDQDVKFTSKLADHNGHIAYIIVETATEAGSVYMIEVAYGTPKVTVGRLRFYGGAVPKQSQRMHSPKIPAGQTVYYRMKCEVASASAEVHLRYHLES